MWSQLLPYLCHWCWQWCKLVHRFSNVSPIVIDASFSTQQTVCCENNQFNGLINIGCNNSKRNGLGQFGCALTNYAVNL